MVLHRIYMFMLDSVSSCRVQRLRESRIYVLLCWLITFNFVNITWIFFRAENIQGAFNLVKGMFSGEMVRTLFHIAPSIMESIFCAGFIGIALFCCLVFKNSIFLMYQLSYRYANIFMIFAAVIFVYALLTLAGRSYTPQFLYFNF